MTFGEPPPGQSGNAGLSHERGSIVRLTPDLARGNPSLFKQTLMQRTRQNPRMAPILAGLERSGRFSQEALVLRDSWVSETTGDNPRITLGFQEIPPQIQDVVFYTGGSHAYPKGYEQQLLYRFTHELAHKYVDFLVFDAEHPEMRELLEYAAQSRFEGNVGFTTFGQIDNHGRQLHQANEDVTELLNMYLWHPQYFADYLNLLADPQAEGLRKQHGLVGLTPESSYHIAQLVESIITSPNS